MQYGLEVTEEEIFLAKIAKSAMEGRNTEEIERKGAKVFRRWSVRATPAGNNLAGWGEWWAKAHHCVSDFGDPFDESPVHAERAEIGRVTIDMSLLMEGVAFPTESGRSPRWPGSISADLRFRSLRLCAFALILCFLCVLGDLCERFVLQASPPLLTFLKLLQSVTELIAGDSKKFGSSGLIVACSLHRSANHLTFDVLEGDNALGHRVFSRLGRPDLR